MKIVFIDSTNRISMKDGLINKTQEEIDGKDTNYQIIDIKKYSDLLSVTESRYNRRMAVVLILLKFSIQ